MQDWRDAGPNDCRTGGMQNRCDSGEEEFGKGVILDMRSSANEGCRKGGIQGDRCRTGKMQDRRFRTGGMQDRVTGKEGRWKKGAGKKGYRKVKIT